MTDRRALWSNGRVAHDSLRPQGAADRYVSGVDHCVTSAPGAALCAAPDGARDRELLWGQVFCVLEEVAGWAFGFARDDGYAGYVAAHMLSPTKGAATHLVSARQTMALSEPNFKATKAAHIPLSLGTPVCVTGMAESWARIAAPKCDLFVPVAHLSPINTPTGDPVEVAERLLGTPYVWGGNSAFGIDCSGLVQAGCRACAIPCPGDSDQQEDILGQTLAAGGPHQRGDVLFWKGHVAWVSGPDTLLHANAHHMSVAYESLAAAVQRIKMQGGGAVTRHARLSRA